MAHPATAPIDAITFADVVAYCNEQHPENVRLDYKRELSSSDRQQIPKAVSAFANTQGGLLILGVAPKSKDSAADERLPELNPAGQVLPRNIKTQIENWCASNIAPPILPEVTELQPNPDDPTRGVVVVRVAASLDTPHAVEDGRGIYVRVADKSEPIRGSVAELQYLFDRRRIAIDLQNERRARLVQRLQRSVKQTTVGSLTIALGPTLATAPMIDRGKLSTGEQLERLRFCARQTIVDGALWIENTNDHGFGVDVFGNVAAVTVDQRYLAMNTQIQAHKYPKWRGSRPVDPSERMTETCVQIGEVAATVVEAFELLRVSRNASEYFGSVRMVVEAKGIVRRMLVEGDERLSMVVAASRSGDDFEVQGDCLTEELGDGGLRPAARMLESVCWAWGQQQDRDWENLIDAGECIAFGALDCPVHCRIPRPANRRNCLDCRRKAAAG